jgi:putative flippase GtrA
LKHLHIQFLQFSAVGAVGTLVHYCILLTLASGLGLNAIAASSAGFACGALTNYLLNYRYTFTSNKRHREAMTKFFIVALIGMLFNGVIMSVCTVSLQWHYLLAQVAATGLVLVWNFIANRFWTFREDEKYRREAHGG